MCDIHCILINNNVSDESGFPFLLCMDKKLQYHIIPLDLTFNIPSAHTLLSCAIPAVSSFWNVLKGLSGFRSKLQIPFQECFTRDMFNDQPSPSHQIIRNWMAVCHAHFWLGDVLSLDLSLAHGMTWGWFIGFIGGICLPSVMIGTTKKDFEWFWSVTRRGRNVWMAWSALWPLAIPQWLAILRACVFWQRLEGMMTGTVLKRDLQGFKVIYPLANTHSYGKWPFIVDFPIEHDDCP